MEIPTFFKAIVDQQGQPAAGEMPHLRVGQELAGKVLRVESDGRLLIDLGLFRALARSNIDVQPGRIMRLQVVKTGVPLHLKAVEQPASQDASGISPGPLPRLAFNEILAPSDQQRLTTLMHRISDIRTGSEPAYGLPDRVQQAMQRISTLFDPLPLNRSVGQIAQYLKTIVEDGGLFFEKKLADAVLSKDEFSPVFSQDRTRGTAVIPENMPEQTRSDDIHTGTRADTQADFQIRTIVGRDIKGQLMILRDVLSASHDSKALADILTEKETAFLRDTVQRLLTHVEGQQESAARRSGEGDIFQVVTHWIPVESQPAPVRLKVYYPHKKKAGEGRYQKVALLLDLDCLGMLRVDLSMVERMLRIDFYVQDEDIRLAIASEADEMAVSLKSLFEQVVITTHVSERKIAQFDQEDINTAAVGGIDIQV